MELPPEDPPGSPQSPAERVWSGFLEALDGLPRDVRLAFLLRELFDTPFEDIAELLGRSPQACRRQVALARSLIQRHARAIRGARP